MWKVILSWIRKPLGKELDTLISGLKIPDEIKALVTGEINRWLGV